MRRILLIVLFVSGAFFLHAQTRQKETREQVWMGFLNQTRLSDKWGVWADFHLRTKEDFVSGLSQGIIRVGLTRYLSEDVKLTVGYAYVNQFPGDNHKNISQPEHRPWQQLQWSTKYPKVRLLQTLRLEERWRHKILNDDALAPGYQFNYRFRYNFASQFPLSKKRFQPGTVSLVLNDEIQVNFGRQVLYNTFDQNRFFAGFNFHVNKQDFLQAGYLGVYQQLAAGSSYRATHAARFFYFHNLDLRKKKTAATPVPR